MSVTGARKMSPDLGAIERSRPKPEGIRQVVMLLGPAFVAAVAYIDPGNVATNVTAGSRYAYGLVWVVVLANIIAVLTQYLSAKLGIATGRTLPELCRDRFPRPVVYLLWGQAEAVAVATDVAEILGGAIGLRLLFGVPLAIGGALTGVLSFVLLLVQTRYGQRPFERLVVVMLVGVLFGFGYTAVAAHPAPAALAGGLVPRLDDHASVLLAAAIMGATIMPHAIYLHSGLIRDRFGRLASANSKRHLLSATRRDVVAAMIVAGAVNVMLIAAGAGVLAGSGVDTIEGAYDAFHDRLGPLVGACFGAGLLASGLVSSSVGTYAGSMILAGFTGRRLPVQLRRLLTVVPAVGILALGVEPTRAMVLSQVMLSLGIPFALWPLVLFTGSRGLMGELVNRRSTTVLAVASAALISLFALVTVVAGD
jgi:manganese transport protein